MNNSIIEIDAISYTYPDEETPVFTDLSIELPSGITTLMGQNGTGKSTLMLLAGARILPDYGTVTIFGKDSSELINSPERDKYVSFVYQNMEFETEEPIGDLLHYVHENGFFDKFQDDLLSKLIDVFELKNFLHKRTQEISKGELQRTIIAFSLLYGSKSVMMDEPVFAMEDYQKERTMGFLMDYARSLNISIFYSAHELELSRKYSDNLLLFRKTGTPVIGKTEELFQKETIEEAYQVPWDMLYKKERLFRDTLLRTNPHDNPENANMN
ncbi:MAG: ATP-binding cassette domain-containing protein [Spirochaetia bacterium]